MPYLQRRHGEVTKVTVATRVSHSRYCSSDCTNVTPSLLPRMYYSSSILSTTVCMLDARLRAKKHRFKNGSKHLSSTRTLNIDIKRQPIAISLTCTRSIMLILYERSSRVRFRHPYHCTRIVLPSMRNSQSGFDAHKMRKGKNSARNGQQRKRPTPPLPLSSSLILTKAPRIPPTQYHQAQGENERGPQEL